MSDWRHQVETARLSAANASKILFEQFGRRNINRYNGRHDVQLQADLLSHDAITSKLRADYPEYAIISEEDASSGRWPSSEFVWVIDPLDGTNNFGYGIAHCAISITLFRWDQVVLAVIVDPLLNREFYATENESISSRDFEYTPLRRATVSLVTNYSGTGREWQERAAIHLGSQCKRTLSMWAPALDLALIARGEIDAMVCRNGYPLDVCGGTFLVASAGGVVLDLSGIPMQVTGACYGSPVSFIAARSPALGRELAASIRSGGLDF